MAEQHSHNGHTSTACTQDEINAAMGLVLRSKYFVNAPMKQKFLRLICEFHLQGRGGELNEYLLGREVFDRDGSYNPATDPIVRVAARGVRDKLEAYYQKEGAQDAVKISIPVGGYEPRFVRLAVPEAPPEKVPQPLLPPEPPAPVPETVPAPVSGVRRWALAATVVALLLLCLVLGGQNVALRQQLRADASHHFEEIYQPVWDSFINSSAPNLLILSNPPVLRFINAADPGKIRREAILLPPKQADGIFQQLPNKNFQQIVPEPRLTLALDIYTGLGEAIGVHYLTHLFDGASKNLWLKQSRTVSADDLKNRNVIVLGSGWVNIWSGRLPVREDFVGNNQVAIENHQVLSGEQAEYKSTFDEQSGNLIEDYALITVSPNISDSYTVMVLAGLHSEGTAAAAEFITSKHHLKELNQRLKRFSDGPPKYYQALLKVGVESGIPTTITLVALHKLPKAAN